MRSLLALALVCFACGCGDRSDRGRAAEAPSSSLSRGPDAIVLRTPRDGGVVRAYLYPRLDSVIWSSARPAPPIARVLAFDQEAGSVAFIDRNGQPSRLELRSGDVGAALKARFASLSSADGWAIYGVAANGDSILRLTPSGSWRFSSPRQRAELALPQHDGSLIVVASGANATHLLRLRPPEDRITDSVALPAMGHLEPTQVGDRIYFRVDSGLIGVHARDLSRVRGIRFNAPIRNVVPTPSADRIFVVTRGDAVLSVIDRFQDRVSARVPLPGEASALRVDPLGRYLLVRAASGDSAWVVAVGTARVLGSIRTTWRADLPLVFPDGAIALAEGRNVTIVDAETLHERLTIHDGALDFWHVVRWNGLRPRSAGLDQPVRFPDEDSARAARASADSVAAARGDTVGRTSARMARADTATHAPPPPPPPPTPAPAAPADRRTGFVVQFAAVLSEPRAQEVAAQITVEGQHPRIVPSSTSGTTIFRVILGPYPARADAERVGRDSKHAYWVYEASP